MGGTIAGNGAGPVDVEWGPNGALGLGRVGFELIGLAETLLGLDKFDCDGGCCCPMVWVGADGLDLALPGLESRRLISGAVAGVVVPTAVPPVDGLPLLISRPTDSAPGWKSHEESPAMMPASMCSGSGATVIGSMLS